ncbi:hypothetical protein AO385_0516 [Moraxella catarrhalis]|uniref:Uncharacterized protein n=1 Tax=Moraxella catarrhalis TaxID=480 RepID=A0A198UQE1_MORCA|nr:hypothetical protein AO383_1232 [Moraxella catarrhalis]OAU98489.1 hypothetical protein AO384_0073 [Moraxella catarrhalis]OAV03438.1 hypothetical protein AO385_0516 [Moraxella catarrhalis]
MRNFWASCQICVLQFVLFYEQLCTLGRFLKIFENFACNFKIFW